MAFSPTFGNVKSQLIDVYCTGCHQAYVGPAYGSLDLVTDPFHALVGADAMNPLGYSYDFSGKLLVKAGDPAASLFFLKISGTGAGAGGCQPSTCPNGEQMPYGFPPLSDGEVEAVKQWIGGGASNN